MECSRIEREIKGIECGCSDEEERRGIRTDEVSGLFVVTESEHFVDLFVLVFVMWCIM